MPSPLFFILPLSPALQEKAADAILKSDLSVRQTELLVKKLTAQEKAQRTQLPEDAQAARDLADLCDRFEKKIYDLELTRAIAENVSIPVIASGGAGTMEDFYDAFTIGKADAALAASLFHF